MAGADEMDVIAFNDALWTLIGQAREGKGVADSEIAEELRSAAQAIEDGEG